MRARFGKVFVIFAAAALLAVPASAPRAAEPAVEIASRGQKIRAILLKPAKPVGSVILLAGGHGKLDIAANGSFAWGRRNQLVRTRAEYQRAGFAVLVPDIAPGWKTADGVVQRYRFNLLHGQDIGALVAYMRTIAEPVVIVATSRGAVSTGVALLVADGKAKPDLVVMTAPMLMPVANPPSFVKAIQGQKAKAQIPTLLVGHKKDQCKWTRPASFEQFRQWRGGNSLDIVLLDGPQGTGNPCEALSAHGFAGIDGEVVKTVTGWIKRQKR